MVYGLGVSGLAASRLLRARGVEVLGIDQRMTGELDLGELSGDVRFEVVLDSDQLVLADDIDGLILSPGISPSRPLVQTARAAGVPVVAEVELAGQFAEGPVIGITGSNGKSTTTSMTGAILEAAGRAAEVCGNIGVPLSAVVEGPAGRVFVVELSSFQLESIDTFHPQAAALLNFSTDHLDRHRDDASYFAAKLRLFSNQNAEDVAVLNADDQRIATVHVASRRRLFSLRGVVEDGCYLDGDVVMEVEPGSEARPLFSRQDLSLPGLHNLENAMAAALLSRAVGVDREVIPRALHRFRGLSHRLQQVCDRLGVVWYDDSKATNLAATQKSLAGFADGTVHLILGGRHKGGELEELVEAASRKVVRAYLIGEAAGRFGEALAGVVACEQCGTLENAVSRAALEARSGEVVLLSPACASFDQYHGFAERGEHFQNLVGHLDG
jgi:UDP-N-acetylmuramoylalanine--D-glutamate ligase